MKRKRTTRKKSTKVKAPKKKTRNRNGMGQGGISYPWETWFKKGSIILVAGKHFDCLTASMRKAARGAGIKFGYDIKTSMMNNNRIKIVATKSEEWV